jgi:hypothetical protein
VSRSLDCLSFSHASPSLALVITLSFLTSQRLCFKMILFVKNSKRVEDDIWSRSKRPKSPISGLGLDTSFLDTTKGSSAIRLQEQVKDFERLNAEKV